MKKILSIFIFTFSISSIAQVGVGTTTPDASSVLDISSTTKGLLIPRMTTAQRTTISSPANGLQVYDTDLNRLFYFNGSQWSLVSKFTNGSTVTNNAIFDGGSVGIGSTIVDNFAKLHVYSNDKLVPIYTETDGVPSYWINANYRNNSYGPILSFRKARGSKATPAAITNGTRLMNIETLGYEGTNFSAGSTIQTVATSNWSVGNTPSKLELISGASNFLLYSEGHTTLGSVGTPETTAILQLNSTDKGFLLPRMTTAQRNAIWNPAIGLQVYDTDTNSIWYRNNIAWIENNSASGGGGGVNNFSILTDNDSDTTIKLELNSDEDIIRFNTNGQERMIITESGVLSMTSDLQVGGNISALSGTNTFGTLIVNNNESVSGNSSIGGSMKVSGNTILGSTETPLALLDVRGRIFSNGSLYIKGNGGSAQVYDIDFTASDQSNPSRRGLRVQNGVGEVRVLGSDRSHGYGLIEMSGSNAISSTRGIGGWIEGVTSNTESSITRGVLVFNVKQSTDVDVTNANLYSWLNNGTPQMTMSNNGNLGIGVTDPASKLDVNGYIKVGSSDTTGDSNPEAGMIRFNSSISKFQGYDGTSWVDLH